MANTSPVIPSASATMFSIVKMSHQNYAEVQTDFVRKNRTNGIFGYWKIKKFDSEFHKLRFNNDCDNPLILIQGWNKFKDFHNLPDDVEVQMIYHGNRQFEVTAVKELKSAAEIPPFHSSSLHPTRTAIFDVELTNMDLWTEKFWLSNEMAAFLQEYNVGWLTLCGNDRKQWSMYVLNYTNIIRMKLGYRWDDICVDYKFKAGDIIRFKFEKNGDYVSSRCHISKLT